LKPLGYYVRKKLIPEMLPDAWDSATDESAFETDLPISTFPESCPWDIDTQILANWWPDAPLSSLHKFAIGA